MWDMIRKRRGASPKHRVKLTTARRQELNEIAHQYGRPHREVLRARILLALEVDPCVTAVAERLNIDVKTVRRWRDRFAKKRCVQALKDEPRSGRPPEIGLLSRLELLSMACGNPSDFGEVSRKVWTIDSLLEGFHRHHPKTPISRTSVLRILNDAEIRPHRVRMWLHSPDPEFKEKVRRICRLYLHPPRGAVVLCIDEKTGIQALGRKYPLRHASPGRAGRVDFEYVRHGTRTLLTAFNPHTGKVYAEVRKRRKADDLLEFMAAVARRYPRKKIYVIWDNLNIHYNGKTQRWRRFNRRHGNRFRFVYTPLHASWVNQVEIFFGIVQKRVLRHGVFNSARQLQDALLRFIDHWNRHEAHPFHWTFKGYPLQSSTKAA
jgi:transposase